MLKQTLTFPQIRQVCLSHSTFEGTLPWLTPLLNCSSDWPTVTELNLAVKKISINFPWEFITQEKVSRRAKARGMGSLSNYLDLILSQGKVPVREKNIHDLLNALSFIMFPLSKTALNWRHHQESPGGLRPGQNRTRTQDHLTIFDEGGVIRLKYSDSDSGSHSETRSDESSIAHDFIFGHAIFEHVIYGKVLRAARLDLSISSEQEASLRVSQATNGESRSQHQGWPSIIKATQQADIALAECLKNNQKFLSSTEFAHLWINP